jgi:hypothetical protein
MKTIVAVGQAALIAPAIGSVCTMSPRLPARANPTRHRDKFSFRAATPRPRCLLCHARII